MQQRHPQTGEGSRSGSNSPIQHLLPHVLPTGAENMWTTTDDIADIFASPDSQRSAQIDERSTSGIISIGLERRAEWTDGPMPNPVEMSAMVDCQNEEICFEPPNFDMEAINALHQQTIRERVAANNSRQRQVAQAMTLGGGAGGSALSSEMEEAQVAGVWAQDIRRLCLRHPDFFSSEEACLRIVDQVRPGTSSYQSLPVNEKNNTDLRQMYNIEYRPKHQSIGSHSTFQ